LRGLDGEQTFLVVAAVLIVLNAGVFTAALARFRRARLLLD
jgi:hypothetical protein